MPKKYTLSQFQQKLFSQAARQSLTSTPTPTPYPFRTPWQGQRDPYAALTAYAAVARGELPHDDRPKPPACTFCDRPAADLPTADWPMCAACFEAVAAPEPGELCELF